jgi:hypothetical protein
VYNNLKEFSLILRAQVAIILIKQVLGVIANYASNQERISFSLFKSLNNLFKSLETSGPDSYLPISNKLFKLPSYLFAETDYSLEFRDHFSLYDSFSEEIILCSHILNHLETLHRFNLEILWSHQRFHSPLNHPQPPLVVEFSNSILLKLTFYRLKPFPFIFDDFPPFK